MTPLKDMETIIHGTSLLSSAFQAAVHGVLRTLIDQLGVTTFNVGISGMAAVGNDLAADFQRGNTTTCTPPVIARYDHGSLRPAYCSCFASHAQTQHGFICLLGSSLHTTIKVQLATFAMHLLLAWGNSTGDNLVEEACSITYNPICVLTFAVDFSMFVSHWSIYHISRGKIGCRIVSRGKLSSQASDFGGLEVFAGASIGHTDAFVVAAALQKAMPKLDNAAANTT